MNDKYTESNQSLDPLLTQRASKLPEKSTSAFPVHATYFQEAMIFSASTDLQIQGVLFCLWKNKKLIFIDKIFHFNKGRVPGGCLHLSKFKATSVIWKICFIQSLQLEGISGRHLSIPTPCAPNRVN